MDSDTKNSAALRALVDKSLETLRPSNWMRHSPPFGAIANVDPNDLVEQMRLDVLTILAPLVAERKIAKMKALKDDHDAFTLVMGGNTSVLQGQDTGDADVNERQGMQGPEHPHRSGDETGADRSSSSGESERSTETHANPSGYEQDLEAPGPSS